MSGIVADLMRPTKNKGSLGETQGEPEVVCRNVPFRTFRTLNGNEQETARRNNATANYSVEVWGDPRWAKLEQCYFQVGTRKLHIAYVNDRKMNGLDLQLLCGESK